MLHIFHYTSLWAYNVEYEEYSADLDLVRDFVLTQCPDDTPRRFDVIRNAPNGLELSGTGLPDDVQAAFENIVRNAFPHKDAPLDSISVHNGRVSFDTFNGLYALVYSPDKEPTYVNSPDENEEIRVKSIGDGWYHVIIYPG